MNKILAGLFSGLMAVFLPACDGINMAKLKPGISTVQDVREIMGPPTMEWQDADGTLTYTFVESVKATYPFYVLRLAGGLLYLSGMLIMLWNVLKTATAGRATTVNIPAVAAHA